MANSPASKISCKILAYTRHKTRCNPAHITKRVPIIIFCDSAFGIFGESQSTLVWWRYRDIVTLSPLLDRNM